MLIITKITGLLLILSLTGCGAGVDLKTMVGTETADVKALAYSQGAKINVGEPDEGKENLPVALMDPSSVCSDIRFYDAEGQAVQGTRNCNIDATVESDPNLKPENIKAGVIAGDVVGSYASRFEDCSADGALGCIALSTFPSVEKAKIVPSDIRSGIIIAGVSGTLLGAKDSCGSDAQTNCLANTNFRAMRVTGATGKIVFGQTLAGINGSAPSRPADCSVDGGVNCVTGPNFPAVDKINSLLPNQSKFRESASIAGVYGTIPDCSSDGDNSCVAMGPTYSSALVTGAAAKIVIGETFAGVSGTAPGRPSDCGTDGETNCVAIPNFPAINKSNLLTQAPKFLNTLTIAGVSGSLGDCASDGGLNCVAKALFPAVDKVNVLTANASKFRSNLTIANVAGTLANCSADAGENCVTAAGFPAMQVSGAAPKIATGQSLGGITGTSPAKPLDCAADAATSCVAVSAFPAIDSSLAAAKIVSGQTLAGVTGAGASRPANCSADGQISCVAVANFPAVDKVNNISLNAAKIHQSVSIGGVSGSLEDCNIDGDVGCLVPASNYAAALNTGASAKIVSGQSLAGITGLAPSRPADCSVDGGIGCVAKAAFPAADALIAPARIPSGMTLGGLTGLSPNGRPGDCAVDGDVNCVTKSSHAAMKVAGADAKIAAGAVIAGVTGIAGTRPNDCSADGELGCVTVTNFPAVDKVNKITANAGKIRTGLTVVGVASTLADCSTDGGTSCVAVTAFPAAKVVGSAAKILTGQSVAGIAGSAAVKPSDCSTDGGLACVAVSAFPAIDKANLQANTAKIRSGYSVVSVNGTLSDCSADGATGCVAVTNFPAAETATAAAKLLSGQILAGVTGTAPGKPADCSSDGGVGCVTTANFPSLNKATNLTPNLSNIHSSVTVAGVSGTFLDCTTDGGNSCRTTSSYPAALVTGADTKIMSGQTLAGVSGTVATKPGNCSADGASGCVSVTNFPSVNKTALTTNADKIKSGVTLAGVAGSLGNCSTDNGIDCVAIAAYPAVNKTNLVAANIKNGVTLAGVTGNYPSSTSPLSVGDGHSDLDTATFNAKMKTATTFGWFDRTGTRQTGIGDADIKAGLIVSGVTIFGTTGSYSPAALNVSSLTATSAAGQIDLDWTGSGLGYIVVRRTDAAVTWTPTNGTEVFTGDPDVNHKIIYKGAALTFLDNTGVDGPTYHYKVYAYNSDFAYSAASPAASGSYLTTPTCGGAGDFCYGDAAATAYGTAITPSGKNIEYVVSYGTFKVWKEVGGNRILKPDGSDNWAKKLNANGKGFSAVDFTSWSGIRGRRCPPNVYIDDTNKFKTGYCLYWTVEANQALNTYGTNGTLGLGAWTVQRWYAGNISVCSGKGMRLPTHFEMANSAGSNTYMYPFADGNPTFGGSQALPVTGYVISASVCADDTTRYLSGSQIPTYSEQVNVWCTIP